MAKLSASLAVGESSRSSNPCISNIHKRATKCCPRKYLKYVVYNSFLPLRTLSNEIYAWHHTNPVLAFPSSVARGHDAGYNMN